MGKKWDCRTFSGNQTGRKGILVGPGSGELSAGKARHILPPPSCQKIADEREPFPAALGCWRAPIEHGHTEGCLFERVRDCMAQLRIGALELPSPAFAYRVPEWSLEIAKERERLG